MLLSRKQTSNQDTAYFPRRPCILCKERKFRPIAVRDRKGGNLTTVVCCCCGLVSHDRIPSDETLSDFYAHRYRAEYQAAKSPAPYRVLREWRRSQKRFRLLRKHVGAKDKIFEIGAGVGCLVKQFQLAGYDAAGIEPGEGFQQYAQNSLLANVTKNFLLDTPTQPRRDLILLIHVLEHLNSPLMNLSQIHRLLNPEGRLYIEVPNLAAPHAAPPRLFHFAHIYNFTADTLIALCEASGFQVSRVFSNPQDKNLRMLFTRGDQCRDYSDRQGYEKTVNALSRYTNLTYHLRWKYLSQRTANTLENLWDRMFAQQRLLALLKRIQKETAEQSAAFRPRQAA